MTAPDGLVYDVEGNPVYIGMAPGFTDAGPFVVVMINGHESVVSAREAWQSGIALVRLVAVVSSGANVVHGLVFSCGDSPEVTLVPEVADEIGACLMGAAISSVGDMATWQHLVTKRGFTDDQLKELFTDVDPVDVAGLLFDQAGEKPPNVFGIQVPFPAP